MNKKWILPIILVVVLLALPLVVKSNFFMHIFILILLYTMLSQAWDLIGGYTGQIAFGNAVFFGIGAYSSTLLFTKYNISPWIGMLAGGVLAVIVALVLGYPVFRLKGHYFLLATLGIGEIFRTVFINWEFVGGAQGLFIQLGKESFWTMQFHASKVPYYYIILILAAAAFAATLFVRHSKLGYYFRAIREDEEAAKAMGISTPKFKLISFSICAFLTALGGTFYAQYIMFIEPYSVMSFSMSTQIVLIAILGGMGYLYGPLLGAAVLITLSESTRSLLGNSASGLHLMIYGLLIILISIYQPSGLSGWFESLKHKWISRTSSSKAGGKLDDSTIKG